MKPCLFTRYMILCVLLSYFKEDAASYSSEYFFLTTLLKRKDETNASPQWAACALEAIFPAD